MRSGNVSGKSKLLINAFLILTIITCLITMTNISLSISLSKNDTIVAKEDKVATTEATEEQADLTTDVVVTRGGAVVNNNDVVREGEYLKYNIKVTNTTEEDIENVVLVATIPEEVKYAELYYDFSAITQPYGYTFSEELTEKIIEIENIKAGETKDLYYEVKVKDLEEGETSRQINTEINSYKGEELIQKFEMSNTIEPAEVKFFLGAFEDNDGSTYGLNIASKKEGQEEIEVKIHFPKSAKLVSINEILPGIKEFDRFALDNINEVEEGEHQAITIYNDPSMMPETKNTVDVNFSEDNTATLKLKTNCSYSFLVYHMSNILADEFEGGEAILTAYVETSDSKYVSNENRIIRYLEDVDISITSDNANEKVKYGEEIEYNLTIENNGRKNAGDIETFDFLQIKLLDYLPEELEPVSVTYDTWEMIVKEQDGVISLSELRRTEVTEDISRIATDKDGNKLANVDLLINIPRNETSNITIKAKAGMVYEETLVENSAIAIGEKISDKVSEKISHTILPYDYVDPENPDDPIDPVDPVDPTDPIDPTDPVDPVDPTNPTDPVNPTNPVNPNNPGTSGGNDTQIRNGNCDFKIDKYISKVTVRTASGTKQYNYNNEKLVKTEIKAKELNGATVTVDYKIVVTNVGQVAGTITRVVDKLPSGFAITSEANKSWPRDAKGEYVNTSKSNLRIEPGESSTLNISATKQMTSETVGNFINEAEIRAAMSISGASETNVENNSSSAELIIAISTGAYVYIAIAILAVVILMAIAVVLYKKGKINIKRIKGASLIVVMSLMILMQTQSYAYLEWTYFRYENGIIIEGNRNWDGRTRR